MAPISEYPQVRERWTWRRQVMDDERTKILSELQVQHNVECSIFSLVATLESNWKVQRKRSVALSIPHLRRLDEESRTRLPAEAGKIRRLLLMIRDVGICEEGQYAHVLEGTRREEDCRRYKISKFYRYEMDNLEHIKNALCQLRKGGPLLGVIKISENYDECQKLGAIYRFDPTRAVEDTDGVLMTHTVCVVCFITEAKVPYFECQEPRGRHFGRNGFLVVDIASVIELYSIRMNVSSS